MKTTITFLLLMITTFGVSAQELIKVEHCATASSINGEITEIDAPLLNNNPDLVVIVEKVRVDDNGNTINNPHFVGVRYNSLAGRWYIHNENPANPMVENSCYKIMALDKSDERAIEEKFLILDLVPGFLNIAPIDDPEINDDSSARCMFSRFQDNDAIQNNNPCEMYYNYQTPGEWYIATTFGEEMPVDCAFNGICNPEGFMIYEHLSAFGNIDSEVVAIDDYAYWTVLDHPLLNDKPNAFFFAQHRREPSTNFVFRSDSIFFNSVTGRWEVHMELESFISGFSFPSGRFYDIFIFDESLSASEANLLNKLRVFPNPLYSVFNIEAKMPISEISLFNMLGQKVKSINGNGTKNIQIDISNYQAGNYFAKIQVGRNFETIKLIKK